MRKKDFECTGNVGTESFGSPRSFLFSDPVLELLRASASNISPGQVSQAIEKGICQAFNVITPCLCHSEMSIETQVTNSTNNRLPIKKWDMGTVSRISIPSSNTEVNDVNTSFVVFCSQQQVSGFYISVDKVFGMDIPNGRNELIPRWS